MPVSVLGELTMTRGPCDLGIVNEAGGDLFNFLQLSAICGSRRKIYTNKHGSI